MMIFADSALADSLITDAVFFRNTVIHPFGTGIYPAHGGYGCDHALPWGGILCPVGRADEAIVAAHRAPGEEASAPPKQLPG